MFHGAFLVCEGGVETVMVVWLSGRRYQHQGLPGFPPGLQCSPAIGPPKMASSLFLMIIRQHALTEFTNSSMASFQAVFKLA